MHLNNKSPESRDKERKVFRYCAQNANCVFTFSGTRLHEYAKIHRGVPTAHFSPNNEPVEPRKVEIRRPNVFSGSSNPHCLQLKARSKEGEIDSLELQMQHQYVC